MGGRVTSPVASIGAILVVGIIIGAAAFYSGYLLSVRTVTTTSIVASVSTEYVTTTSTFTASPSGRASLPPVAIVSVSGVAFPSNGTAGEIVIYNLGSANTTVVSASLSYSDQTCFLSSLSSLTVTAGSSTVYWAYSNGDACPTVPSSRGTQFVGALTFSNGMQLTFTGAFR